MPAPMPIHHTAMTPAAILQTLRMVACIIFYPPMFVWCKASDERRPRRQCGAMTNANPVDGHPVVCIGGAGLVVIRHVLRARRLQAYYPPKSASIRTPRCNHVV